ncbi:Ig-like domain-containing protein (plasmid) [Photobacterium sp. GJ3]|uniref:Ig-like domain-containing protein n=1 Tax=Photobacterium sp. GJ3 TaxID=2829502 RepID=UPI001B8CA9C4|nr:Ig-like domain-containing protein [Photobacterium sp. GJ3]QUJ69964.1 Ig-like domain-containing protein [Photobacterium sp. GJ3]
MEGKPEVQSQVTGTYTVEGTGEVVTSNTVIVAVRQEDPTLTKIQIHGVLSYTEGETGRFSVVAAYENPVSTEDVTAQTTWINSNPSVANVSADGHVTAVKAGTATITATFNGKTGIVTMTVHPKTVLESISITGDNEVVALETLSLRAIANFNHPESSEIIANQVVWASSDTSIAEVSHTGVVSTSKSGTVKISATFEGKTSTKTIVVKQRTGLLQAISNATDYWVGDKINMQVNQTYLLPTTYVDVLADTKLTSSNPSVVKVDGTTLTAVGEGTTIIGVHYNGKETNKLIRVYSPYFDSVFISTEDTIRVGRTGVFKILGYYSNPERTVDLTYAIQSTRKYRFILYNTRASFSFHGKYLAKKPGENSFILKHKDGTKIASKQITIIDGKTVLDSVSISGSDKVVALDTLFLEAVANYNHPESSKNITNQVVWASSDTSIAEVSHTGVVSTSKSGTVKISATFEGKTSTKTIVVKQRTGLLQVISNATDYWVGDKINMQVSQTYLLPTMHVDVLADTKLTSSNPSVVKVDGTTLTAVGEGTAVIGVNYNGKETNKLIRVYSPYFDSVSISTEDTIRVGRTGAFKILGYYSNPERTVDLTYVIQSARKYRFILYNTRASFSFYGKYLAKKPGENSFILKHKDGTKIASKQITILE